MSRTVEVEVGNAGLPAPLARVAERLGVELSTDAGSGDVTRLGDVVLTDGAPEWAFEAALLRALGPKHLLFLCVANSARSQIGEGLARSLAPADVRISSAGSEPTRVRPQAIEVLREVGIDASGHESNGVDDIERTVDAVITLCAEEVCPVWLGKADRLHWGLPDPAGSSDDPDQELQAFRDVRDELSSRLRVLFEGGRV